MYGDEMCVLDPVSPTTKNSHSVFLVEVRTNTVYQVVGTFIISDKSTEAVVEGLEVLKEWNPGWQPRHWLTDCCDGNIDAVEGAFPGE